MNGIPDEHRETIEEYIKAAQELMPNAKIIVFEATLPEPDDGDTEYIGGPDDRDT